MSRLIAQFAGPPADRMAGRQQARAARAQGNYTPRQKVSAATTARANSFLDRETLLDAAVHQGVIGGALRGHFAECYDKDPSGTRSYLQSLGLSGGTSAAAASQGYVETHLSPGERERVAAAREGRRSGRIVNGGL